jgi:hypothetical protein
MKYVQCSRCRARFHTGVIYETVEVCGRCGAPLGTPRVRDQLRTLLHRRRERLDWEAITGSQYASRLTSPQERTQPGS